MRVFVRKMMLLLSRKEKPPLILNPSPEGEGLEEFESSLKILFYNTFFIQSELKGGYINMPSIRTTKNKSDKACQAFFYGQYNIVFGGKFRLGNK